MDEKWDHLVILTACRYDVFKRQNPIPGRLEKRISVASRTLAWSKKNFTKYYEDVVYVSANPRVSDTEFLGFKGSDHFFKVVNVWGGWDEELCTIPPGEVTKVALQLNKKYPNKRMIVHYLQPHAPWIGETRLSGKELGLSYPTVIARFKKSSEIGLGLWGIWEKAIDMGISLKLIRKAYSDNLKLVLSEVRKLVDELDGRIIITADHGQCLGGNFLIENPTGIYVKELVEVPWLVIQNPKNNSKGD